MPFQKGNLGLNESNIRVQREKEAEITHMVEDRGYTLESEYVNKKTRITINCNKGHESVSILPQAFKKGDGCPMCTLEEKRKNFENKFICRLKEVGYELLTEYRHAREKVELRCDHGHTYMVRPNDFNNGSRCPECDGSTGQRMLWKKLKERGLKLKLNDRNLIHPYELDIVVLGTNIAIEYQGNYWHSRPEVVERDSLKKNLCKKYNIMLWEVWDNDFLSDPDAVTEELYLRIKKCQI